MTSFPFVLSRDDNEPIFYSNMVLDGRPHLIELAAVAKVFNL